MLIDQQEMERRLNSAHNAANVQHKIWRSHRPLSTDQVNTVLDNPKDKLVPLAEKSGMAVASVRSIREDQARDVAMDKLMATLGLIDRDKLQDLSAKELARVSADMAGVYHKLSPSQGISGPQVNVVVYAPELRQEGKYKMVEV